MKTFLNTLCVAIAAVTAAPAFATTIYKNSFESGPGPYTGIDGGYVSPTIQYSTQGFGAYMYIALGVPDREASFTLNDPNGYKDVTLSLSLAILGPWTNNSFDISVDGKSVFDATFDNVTSPTTAPGLTLLSYGSNLGFYTLGDSAAYDLTVDLGSLAPDELHSYAFTATGLDSQSGLGLDNILITGTNVNAVPEPTNAALLALGLAGVGIAARRRRAG